MDAKPRPKPWLGRLAPDSAFAGLAAAFGLAFAALTPPLQTPDEVRHLGRAFLLSEGRLLAERAPGGASVHLPRDLVTMEQRLGPDVKYNAERKQEPWRIRRELTRSFDAETRVSVAPPSFYTPLSYLPQAAAVGMGRLLGLSPLLWLYLGRLANLGVWLAITAWAVRRVPAHRWLLALLALTPMSLFMAASLSTDASSNALAFLFISSVLRSREAPGPLGRREALALLAMTALVGLTKQVYWPMCGALLLVPPRRFASRGHRAGWLALAIGGSAALVGLWTLLVQSLDPPPLAAGVDPGAQLRFILEDPSAFVGVVVASVEGGLGAWIASFIGVLGYVDTWLPGWTYWTTSAALLAVALLKPALPRPRAAERIVLVGVALACFASTLLVAYVGWNVVGAPHVDGVQGRYFIPFAPLALLALGWRERLDARAGALLGVHAGIVLAAAVVAVVLRYWVG